MTTGTIGAETSVGYRVDQVAVVGGNVRFAMEGGAAASEQDSVRVRSIGPRNTHSAGVERKTVLRRMRGFLIEVVGQEAKVAFVEDGVTHEYYLPADRLQEAMIRSENQPFQMDEVSIKSGKGIIVGYEFQPLAQPCDAFVGSFALDPARERKRALIFKTFGHAKD